MSYSRKIRRNIMNLMGVALIGGSVIGCGSATSGAPSGGGTDVVGLSVADQVSLVTANSEASPSMSALSTVIRNRFIAPTTSDYVTDTADYHVSDRSMDALRTINSILCSFDQIHYSDMVNQGAYIALVDSNLCDQSNQDHSGDSQNQSTSQEQSYETWVVDSSRASNDANQVVDVWITGMESGHDPFNEIHARMTITEAASETNPFGNFDLEFSGYADGDPTPVMNGYLISENTADGDVELSMQMSSDGVTMKAIHAVLSSDGVDGHAYVYDPEESMDGGGEVSAGGAGLVSADVSAEDITRVAFNEDHYQIDENGTQTCRSRTLFDNNVFQYNLYNQDGSRVSLNSGVGFQVGDYYGFVGYYGLWAPQEAGITSDMSVLGDDGNNYTIFQGAGRLTRQTRHATTLESFVDDTFDMWDNDTGGSFQVTWNGTQLIKTAEFSCDGDSGCGYVDLDSDEVITVSPNQYISLFKDGFGSVSLVVPDSGVINNSTEVPYFTYEQVAPNDDVFADSDTISLICFFGCPRTDLTQEDVDSGANLFLDDIQDSETEPYIYTFNPATYELSLDGHTISASSLDLSATFNSWGVQTGGLILLADAGGIENPWEVWDQDVVYTYETGPNDWNRYSTLLDSDHHQVDFDAPMECEYDGEEGFFRLTYGGDGNLWGLPYEEVEDGDYSYWKPAFSLADGTELTCGGDSYYIRQMNVEQRMQDADDCSDVTIDTSISAPTHTFTDPEVGDAPDVSDQVPAVIGGELQ